MGLHVLVGVVAENAEQLVVGLENKKFEISPYSLLAVVHLHVGSELHGLNLGKDSRSTHRTLGERAQTSSQHFFNIKSKREETVRENA